MLDNTPGYFFNRIHKNIINNAIQIILLFGLVFISGHQNPVFAADKNSPSYQPNSKQTLDRRTIRKKRFYPKGTQKTPQKPETKTALVQNNSNQTATFDTLRRDVEIQSPGDSTWRKATKDTVIKKSDRIRTGNRAMARVKLEDGTKVVVLQNSQAEVETLSKVEKAISLIRGRLRAFVKKVQGGNNFKVKTPIGVASVRGTDFEVEFLDESQDMQVEVFEGQVGVSKLGELGGEVLLNPGERIQFGIEGEIGDPIRTGGLPSERQDVRSEVQITRVKEAVLAQAAEELRNADYQVGKSLIDVDGSRVRVEEYITRPAANQFKLVALNERANRFDYFTYKGTFNQDLPEDLSVALSQVGGKVGTEAPDYYLTEYEMVMSNTQDNITETAAGGHLVKIVVGDSDYALSENPDADDYDMTNTRTIDKSELQGDSTYKYYNPLRDAYAYSTSEALEESTTFSINDNGTYRNLASGDTVWKTRFDSLNYSINSNVKTSYSMLSGINHMLSITSDADFAAKPTVTYSQFPSGTDKIHSKLTLQYEDGSVTTINNYIIDDEGNIASRGVFSGLSTSASYQEELKNWNYQQKISSTDMADEINLVIDPRIGTISGLIQ